MASLAIALGGALLGNVLGVGASIGWIVGSIVGNLLFPPDPITTEGPRLGDLTITASTYGGTIPIAYGTMRMSGNMMWSTGIEEVKNKNKTGGKGLQQQRHISYDYFSTFAIGFCEGVADDVLRLWADGKIIYDKTSTTAETQDDLLKDGLAFRFYDGSETQEPDGLIEADKGVGMTPAFRGMCYIVFERLPLLDFANRVPNITAEITFEAQPGETFIDFDFFTVAEGGISDNFDLGRVLPDYKRSNLYLSHSNVSSGFLRRGSARRMEETLQKVHTLDGLGNTLNLLTLEAVMPDGHFICNSRSSTRQPITLFNPNTLDVVDTFGVSGPSSNNSPSGFEALGQGKSSWVEVLGPDGSEYYPLTVSAINNIGLLRAKSDSLEYVWDSDTAPDIPTPTPSSLSRVIGTCAGAVGDNFGEGYLIAGANYALGSSSNAVTFYKITVNAGANYDGASGTHTGVDLTILAELTPLQIIPGLTSSTLKRVHGLIYDKTDDTIMLQVKDSIDLFWLVKFDPSTGDILWRTEMDNIRIETMGMNHSRVTNGIFAQHSGTRIQAFRTNTGEKILDSNTFPGGYSTSGAQWFDNRTNMLYGTTNSTVKKWPLFRGEGGSADLDAIMQDLSERAGIVSADIDATDLATETVPGYVVTRQTSARAAIQPLASIFFFDGVESDFKLKYLLRDGKSTVATIPQEDLAVLDERTGEFFRENRTQEVELPHRISIAYMNRNRDYQQAMHSARRILAPSSSMDSRNEIGMAVAAALPGNFVKRAAEKVLYSSWIERSSYSTRVSWEYLALDPGDVVDVLLDDGTLFRTRVVQNDVGLGLAIDVSAISEDAAQYTDSETESDEGDDDNQVIKANPQTKLILLCTPLLRDRDDVARTRSTLYFFMGGYGDGGWTAAILYKSVENTQFEQVGAVVSEMSWGTAVNALGDVDRPFATDETNTLRVAMTTGEDDIGAVTQLEMLNGANAAALVHSNGTDVEVIQWRDVVVEGDGSRTLSGLLRGRRGTEVNTGGHSAGAFFVLLDAESGGLLPLSLGEKDQTRFYRGVTSGQLFEDSDLTTKISPLNDLKPYAVADADATLGGGDDITLTWKRRTRVGGELIDGTGTVPLSEDSEEYELEIFDGPGGTEVREVTGLSAPTFVYTSGDQTTDGFSPPLSKLTVKIYQISAQVGRGLVEEQTLDVV